VGDLTTAVFAYPLFFRNRRFAPYRANTPAKEVREKSVGEIN
jgi:hypothetical protein